MGTNLALGFFLFPTIIVFVSGGYHPPAPQGGYQHQHQSPGGYSGGGSGGYGHGGGYQYGGYQEKKNPFLPAPPGETPECGAKPGTTYCEKVETYPMEQIHKLLYKWGRTYTQFIRNENESPLVFKPVKGYGPPPHPQPQPQPPQYGPPGGNGGGGGYDENTSYYLPPPQQLHANANGSNSNFGGNNDYYRNKQPSFGYDYSYSIPPPVRKGYGQSYPHQEGGYSTLSAMAAIPPIIHSIWWNHRNQRGEQAFPHIQRWKRQASPGVEVLCPTTSRFVTPRAAMNNEGNWMYVVNMGDTAFQQLVRAELCANGDGSQCSGVCSIAPGRRATCRQQYVQKRLVALDGSGETLRNDVFWIPHCCLCEIS